MRRIAAGLRFRQPLDAVRKLAGSEVDRARSELVRAAARLRLEEARAGELTSATRALADWARAGGGVLQPAVHACIVRGLAEGTRAREEAAAACERHSASHASAREVLVLVRARQQALDRVAERVSARARATGAARQSREMDEQWLCSSHLLETGQ